MTTFTTVYKIFLLTLLFAFSSHLAAQGWVPAGTVTNPGVRPSISVCSPDIAWISDGAGNTPKIFRTTNGGTNWDQIPTGGITNEIYCIWGMGQTIAFAGEGVVNGNAKLLLTTNSGMNWVTILTTGSNGGYFNGLGFTKANGSLFGLAIAERLYRTSNYGLNWVEINSGAVGVSNAQNSLTIIDNYFYGFGLNNGAARVRLTTDNSLSWVMQTISVTGNYTSAIAFHTNKMYGVAATSTSLPTISRTTDGGTTWSSIDVGSGVTGSCYMNWVPYTPVVYIMGGNGGIKRSTDNGLTWVTTPTNVSDLNHFDFMQAGMVVYGYAVSSNGTVIKIADTLNILTGLPGEESTPNSFSLKQNYPNPFNPVTSIEYSLPKTTSVNISVFDALGRKVETLVDELKTAGRYEVTWNAADYSSGFYFYKIQTGDFSDVKKMILIK